MIRGAALLAVVALLGACSADVAPTADADDTSTSSIEIIATPSTSDGCPTRTDRMDMAYVEGGEPGQRLDLYVPSDAGCAPFPLVVWVHGGGWQIGDKANGMDSKVSTWTEAGWAVASVNYRLTNVAAPAADRVLAPAHNEDVAAALAWLITKASALGIDPEHIALLGHSAGAGITAAVVTDPVYLGAHELDPSTLACAAPLDTEAFDIAAVLRGGGQLAQLYEAVFGSDPTSAAELSPITHVGEARLPDLFLVLRGSPARRALVTGFADTVERAGGAVTVVDLPTFSHADVSRRIGDPTDDQLTPALQQFLTACLSTAATG